MPVQKSLLEVQPDLRCQLRPAMAVVGGARQGQFRRGRLGLVGGARLPSLLKHGQASNRLVRPEHVTVRSDARRGDSWSRPDTMVATPTDESPTLFQATPGKLRAHKSMTKRLGSRSGANGGPTPLAQGWQRPQSKPTSVVPKGDTVVGRLTTRDLMGTVSFLPKRSRVGIVRPPRTQRIAKKHSR